MMHTRKSVIIVWGNGLIRILQIEKTIRCSGKRRVYLVLQGFQVKGDKKETFLLRSTLGKIVEIIPSKRLNVINFVKMLQLYANGTPLIKRNYRTLSSSK